MGGREGVVVDGSGGVVLSATPGIKFVVQTNGQKFRIKGTDSRCLRPRRQTIVSRKCVLMNDEGALRDSSTS